MTSQTKEEKKEELSPKLSKIVEEIEKLSLLEVSDLVKALEKKFGISASMPLAVAQAPAAAGAAATSTPQEEKTEFNLILSSAGANKISAIKAVREIKPEMGLKEAKDFVEAAPQELLKGVDKKTAEEAKKKLEAAGCQVELK
jgi:large subunit ribosomal protein L7/L12